MKNNINANWHNVMKFDIIKINLLLKQIKEIVVLILLTNAWILEDTNLFESFTNIKNMIDVSDSNLEDFIRRFNLLENGNNESYISDLKDEFDIIHENIMLEASYILNMIDYMAIVDDYTLDESELLYNLEQYQDIDVSCYNQMIINNENLKQLKKERRDYFE